MLHLQRGGGGKGEGALDMQIAAVSLSLLSLFSYARSFFSGRRRVRVKKEASSVATVTLSKEEEEGRKKKKAPPKQKFVVLNKCFWRKQWEKNFCSASFQFLPPPRRPCLMPRWCNSSRRKKKAGNFATWRQKVKLRSYVLRKIGEFF